MVPPSPSLSERDSSSADDIQVPQCTSAGAIDSTTSGRDEEDVFFSSEEGLGLAKSSYAPGASNKASAKTSAESGNTAYYDADEDEESVVEMASHMCTGWNWLHIFYLSFFSTIGVTVRAFMGRFFGGDCEAYTQGQPIDDWLWPLSHKICITATGKTEQYGGALFSDLPANMFGSFIMGFMTGHSPDLPPIPWLKHDHPLQSADSLHLGIKTALCGSLTTFSSWNSQMVLMMDGTSTVLGSQVLAALFGYVIGFQAAVVSYRSGRIVAAWFHVRRNPHIFDSDLTKRDNSVKWHYKYCSWIAPVMVCIIILTLITLYMLGDMYWHIAYYRVLWIACWACPTGTIIRWKLSSLNGKYQLPLGTFLANFIGSILSASLAAWATIESNHQGAQRWEIPIIKAVSLGVAGSLSTVSTFAKECVEMSEKNATHDKKQFLYAYGTMISCCFVGLAVYSPIVRYVS